MILRNSNSNKHNPLIFPQSILYFYKGLSEYMINLEKCLRDIKIIRENEDFLSFSAKYLSSNFLIYYEKPPLTDGEEKISIYFLQRINELDIKEEDLEDMIGNNDREFIPSIGIELSKIGDLPFSLSFEITENVCVKDLLVKENIENRLKSLIHNMGISIYN